MPKIYEELIKWNSAYEILMEQVVVALERQHLAAFAMLRQAIENFEESEWEGGIFPRNPWRIAFHAALYAHLYLYENLDMFVPWDKSRKECSWLDGEDIEVMPAYSKQEILDYVDLIIGLVPGRMRSLDLTEAHCGFTWYPNVSRVELLILSLRHLHGHIGQLSEILISQGSDVEWLGQAPGI